MATIPNTSHGAFSATPRRTYIALRPYNADIFSYATSLSAALETVGTFSSVAGATATNCLQGAILHETGKKLYAGVQPNVNTYMVSVFDYANSLTGFIDPNSSAFTLQNTDRPYAIASPGSNAQDQYADRAPPVYTRGNIFGQSNLDISGSGHIYGSMRVDAGRTVYNGENVYGTATLYSNAFVASTLTTSTLSVTTGKIFLNNTITGRAQLTSGAVTVTTPACTTNSLIFLQHSYIANPFGILYVTSVANGSFVIRSSQNETSGAGQFVFWMIVN
jgi:hypothetical protein